MTVKNLKHGQFQFRCNCPSCAAELTVTAGTVKSAWDQARTHGWLSAKVGARWLHWCCWVHRPSDAALNGYNAP